MFLEKKNNKENNMWVFKLILLQYLVLTTYTL